MFIFLFICVWRLSLGETCDLSLSPLNSLMGPGREKKGCPYRIREGKAPLWFMFVRRSLVISSEKLALSSYLTIQD